MQLINGIKERRSIRKYKSDKVSKETIEKIIDAARYAPSWKNSQTARYGAGAGCRLLCYQP